MQDIRQVLMEFGLGSFGAQLATQSVFYRPVTLDPDAQVTIMLVKGVQRGLNRLGAELALTGYFDEPTVRALLQVSGPRWPRKKFAEIFHDLKVGHAIRADDVEIPRAPASPLGSDGLLGALGGLMSPLGLVAGGTAAYLIYRACRR